MRALQAWRLGVGRGATAVALVVVAACGGGGDDDDGAGSDGEEQDVAAEPAEAADAAGAAAFPVEVEHALGVTEIEAAPERVVSVGYTEQDTLLALGITPVAVTDWYGDQPYATWPWAQDELGDAQPEVLTVADGFQYERIADLDPDLIVGTNAGIDAESYAVLSDIAPTIAHPAGAPPWFSQWDDQSRLIAQAVGREAAMDEIIADIDDRFAEAAADHPEFASTSVAFLQNAFYDGEAIAYQEGLSTDFLTDLGFGIPEELDAYAPEEGQAYIPLEQLSTLDAADVLLWATENPEDRTALESQPLYLALEEVREGRLVFTDGLTAGAIYFTSPLSLPFVIDQIVPALASTLAGDGPATITATP
jgi:iron complex transport system substrate-binding protein